MPSTIRYRWGDVVLVAFPLSDMSGAVRRPGLVLFDSGDEDMMPARITTQRTRDRTDVRLADWKAAGLIAQSVIRLSKTATIRKSLVDRRLGVLSPKDKSTVRMVWERMFPSPR
jgi:PemK-like, MazF-like toxin of type II toxin-antitoxin system